MVSFSPKNVKTILCIGCHSDDIEIGCGGTILRLLDENEKVNVYWLVLGANETREKEAFASADVFLSNAGTKNVIIKQFRDAYFPFHGLEIKEFLHKIQEDIPSPDIIFTHRHNDLHQDHNLVAQFTLNVFRHHLIVEYEIPKYDGDLGLPNLYVPLSKKICKLKVDTITEAFQSQGKKHWFSADTFWSLLRIRGLESNSPSKYAEGLYCRKMVW